MKIIIQKFGGTSVATPKRRELMVDKIIAAKENGYSPVVVVSAIGRKGDPYSTDTLISLIKDYNPQIDKRNHDLLLSCGEIISSVIAAETINTRGYKTYPLTGGQAGIITNDSYGNADVLNVETERIIDLLSQGIIPVVAGFQGRTQNGDITTLGRGASDTTAAILGEALKACAIEIYTDVDGIMTADPRIVPEARVIDKMSYNEVFQFADQGAKVIHPRAVEYAMRGNVPLLIKNTMSDAPGTIITSTNKYANKIITGIAHMPNRTQISVSFDDNCINNNLLFNIMAENGISIDLINVFPNYKVFTIDDEDTKKAQNIMNELNLKYKCIMNCSKIACIGESIRGIPGVMANILSALSKENIDVLQTADSHTTIWCLVKGEDTVKAINVLHKTFE